MTLPTIKRQWRTWLSAIKQPPPREVNNAVIGSLEGFLDAHDGLVLSYFSMPSEIDLARLLERPDGDRIFVTRTPDRGPLTVHHASDQMETHRYGFKQPTVEARPVDPGTISIALVPGVAFGHDGSRLGHGAGYYDRLLPQLSTGAFLIGISWSATTVDALPMDQHDVHMTHIVTESGVRTVA
ncbi:MAG: 5-formyltetrahydrofolate cyclo-ligase [Actinomycetia bacterium]|nr:5-formyltetrahydrofolate cyclo-ligase [Actinomycetes bacterium]MCP4962949.1 5-formyltetrahydrofolate cyclo-ligase [Actinomycetes bacterium]